jgi:hypothetical protein
MQPELALKILDAIDSLAYAARIVCAGYWGRRLRVAAGGIVAAALTMGFGQSPF